jgi:hypothetical protein
MCRTKGKFCVIAQARQMQGIECRRCLSHALYSLKRSFQAVRRAVVAVRSLLFSPQDPRTRPETPGTAYKRAKNAPERQLKPGLIRGRSFVGLKPHANPENTTGTLIRKYRQSTYRPSGLDLKFMEKHRHLFPSEETAGPSTAPLAMKLRVAPLRMANLLK